MSELNHCSSQARETCKQGLCGFKPLLFHDKCSGFFYMYSQSYGLMSHPQDKAFEGNKCQDRDMNPHSADQIYQSSRSVLLTSQPRLVM